MKSKSFALSPGGEKRIRVDWSGGYKNAVLWADGQEVAVIHGKAVMKQGVAIQLGCGAYLELQLLSKSFVESGLQVRLDGVPVAGSALSAYRCLRLLMGCFIFAAFVQLVFGINWLIHAKLTGGSTVWFLAGAVLVSAGLNVGFAVGASKGIRAFGLAGAIAYTALLGLFFAMTANLGAQANYSGFFFPIVFLIGLWRILPSASLAYAESQTDARFQGIPLTSLDGPMEFPAPHVRGAPAPHVNLYPSLGQQGPPKASERHGQARPAQQVSPMVDSQEEWDDDLRD